jgi:hypothetical protein
VNLNFIYFSLSLNIFKKNHQRKMEHMKQKMNYLFFFYVVMNIQHQVRLVPKNYDKKHGFGKKIQVTMIYTDKNEIHYENHYEI